MEALNENWQKAGFVKQMSFVNHVIIIKTWDYKQTSIVEPKNFNRR